MKNSQTSGFTLIELLIVVLIISLLVGYAVPSYRQYVLRSQRTEAHNALLQLAGIQERYYANTNRYGSANEINLTTLFPAPTAANKLHYIITMQNTNTSYNIVAKAYGTQTRDTDCLIFSLDNLGQKTPTANCW